MHASPNECRVKQQNQGLEQTGNKMANGALRSLSSPLAKVGHCLGNGCPTHKQHLLFGLTGVEPSPQRDDDIEPNHNQSLDLRVKSRLGGRDSAKESLTYPVGLTVRGNVVDEERAADKDRDFVKI